MSDIVIKNEAKLTQMLINACDSFIRHYDEYQGDMNDVILAASFSKAIADNRDGAVNKDAGHIDDEPPKTLDQMVDAPAPGPGYKFVLGKGWVKA